MNLVPYVEMGGARTIADVKLFEFFEAMERDHLVDIVFHTGTVKTSEQFINVMQRPCNIPVFVEDDGIKGLAWLNNVDKNNAIVHFCFLKCYWGDKAIHAGKAVLKYWFDFTGSDGLLFDTLIGFVPETNKRVVEFCKKLGSVELGTIPKIANLSSGRKVGMVVMYTSRESCLD